MPHFFVVVQYGTFVALKEKRQIWVIEQARRLRVVFDDGESTYYQLLDRAATTSLYNLRVKKSVNYHLKMFT